MHPNTDRCNIAGQPAICGKGVIMELPVKIREMLEQLDSTTYNHSLRVWKMAVLMEAAYGMEDGSLSTAALVHDIGKLYIPERILDKHGGLTGLEREVIGLHPYYGYRLLKDHGVDEEVGRLVLYHHGMNPALAKSLPEYHGVPVVDRAKMLHTIDAFEALTTDRPYRRRMSVRQAADFLEGQEGYHPVAMSFLRENAVDF